MVPGIEEDIIPTSEPEYKMPVHVIPDEGEIVRPNGISEKLSEITYLKKDADADSDADISAYDRVLNALKELDTSYNPTINKINKPVIEGNHKVTRDTRFTPIMEHGYDEIQWACSTSISADAV